jgi:hypothetical protein
MPTNQSQRPKFYEEQYLSVADLTAAVDYSRIQQARHALGAHTWGIAIGLQLKETPQLGGAVSVHLLPGYAWDGYGRPIVVLSPYKIPEELFSSIKFNQSNSDDENGKGRLIKIWLRYDETATQNPRSGFEVCNVTDQFSRIQETFRLEISESELNDTDRSSGITIGTKTLSDAKTALQAFDPTAPPVYDESIPQQTFPEPEAKARWLIPIGYVRWLPVQNQAGHFVARDDSEKDGAEKDSDKIRRARQYIGVVAGEIEAADGTIRLRDRSNDPLKSPFQAPLTVNDSKKPPVNDLVWVEGHMRVLGDARLCGGKLDFHDHQGKDLKIPLAVQRANDGSALQLVIGRDTQSTNRLAVGPLKASDGSCDEKFVVLSNGNVGIGTTNPNHKFHVLAQGEVGLFESSGDQAYLRLTTKEGLGKRVEITNRPGGRFSVWTPGGGDSFNVSYDGKVGIGTTDLDPLAKLHVIGRRILLENAGKRVEIRADGGAVDLQSETNDLYIRSINKHNVIINSFNNVDGNVGIGTPDPNAKLHVEGTLRITGTAYGGPWTNGSDVRLKKGVAPLSSALRRLLQLRGVSFEWNEPEKMGNLMGRQMGLVAQEVEPVFPEWVSTGPDGYKELTVRGFEALTIEALRELHGEIEALKKRLDQFTKIQPYVSDCESTGKDEQELTHETRN